MSKKSSPVGTIRVFVASPGDVSIERDSLAGVINELNRTIAALVPETGVRLELVRWETHAHPAMGRPQGVINDQIGAYDIFIGILWKRFGTPTGRADSGTEEEFELAYDSWTKAQKPRILFYFNQALTSVPRSTADVEQLGKVVRMKQKLEAKGLIWEYPRPESFAETVRPHLTEVIGEMLRAARTKLPPSSRTKGPRALRPVSGRKIRITEIGTADAFYEDHESLVGMTGTLVEMESSGEWTSGSVRLDKPRFSGDDGLYMFAEFKYEFLT